MNLVLFVGLQETSFMETPIEFNVNLRKDEGELLSNPALYRNLVGSLVYLTINRPYISFAVQQVSRLMVSPRHSHMAAVKRIIRCIKGTSMHGLLFPLVLSCSQGSKCRFRVGLRSDENKKCIGLRWKFRWKHGKFTEVHENSHKTSNFDLQL